jgi:4-amino-4-deoxy-L-arabinose transferase-like glycosyltransferase
MSTAARSGGVPRAAWQGTALDCLVVLLIWAGIYLPALGSLPLQHEEPRRALPALHMLSSGDWLVPRVGSEPYLRKPPLLNWLIALSFVATGTRTEAAARLPSVLATAALALTIVIVAGRGWLARAARGRLAAVFFLTNLAMMETGRLAELEALYVALTGMALALWLAAWHRRLNPWRVWLAPAPFLALGMLAKGPVELVFYYGIILPILVLAKERRALLHPAHGLALAAIAGAFLAWAIPCSQAIDPAHPAAVWGVWLDQLTSRASGQPDEHFHLGNYLACIPLSAKNFLPWTVLVPLLWGKNPPAAGRLASRDECLFRGARWGMAAVLLVMSLLPNGSPRYLYPLLPVPALLLEQALADVIDGNLARWVAQAWRQTNLVFLVVATCGLGCAAVMGPHDAGRLLLAFGGGILATFGFWPYVQQAALRGSLAPKRCALLAAAATSSIVMVLITLSFAVAVVPRINQARTHGPREMAESFRRVLPSGALVWMAEPSYQPFWYYLEPNVRYVHAPDDVPADARFVLIASRNAGDLGRDPRWREAVPLVAAIDGKGRSFSLFELGQSGAPAASAGR